MTSSLPHNESTQTYLSRRITGANNKHVIYPAQGVKGKGKYLNLLTL